MEIRVESSGPGGFMLGAYNRAGDRLGYAKARLARRGVGQYLRLVDLHGPAKAQEVLIQAAARRACETSRLAIGSDVIRGRDQDEAWKNLAKLGAVHCAGALPDAVARSWNVPPGQCSVWLSSCSPRGLSGHPRRRSRR